MEDHMVSLFILTEKPKFSTPPDRLADIDAEISKLNLEISQISRELETENSENENVEKLKIPEFLWSRFLNINFYCNNPIVGELIVVVGETLENVQLEYSKLENIRKLFRNSEIELRMWMGFIYNIWVSSIFSFFLPNFHKKAQKWKIRKLKKN